MPLLWKENPASKLDTGWKIYLLDPEDCPPLSSLKSLKISIPVHLGWWERDTLTQDGSLKGGSRS